MGNARSDTQSIVKSTRHTGLIHSTPTAMSGHSHRPTLKQSNKSFKTKHSSKGSLKDAAKGRVAHNNDSSSGGGAGTANGKKNRSTASLNAAQKKAARKNTAKQIQAKKRAEIVQKNRLTKGSEAKAPRVVAVVQLCEDVDNTEVVAELLGGADLLDGLHTVGAVQQVEMSNPRTTLQFMTPAHGDLMGTLDACAVADFVVLSLSGATEVGAWGEICLRSLASLGVGDGAVRGIVSALPENAAAATQVRKSLHSFLRHFFPSLERVHSPATTPSEASNLLRSLGDRLPRGVSWREHRARLLAEEVEWTPSTAEMSNGNGHTNGTHDNAQEQEKRGTLAITGVVRGGCLSANRLVHLQGFGDFQVDRILSASTDKGSRKRGHNAMDDTPALGEILSEPNPSEADDLVSTNVPSDGDMMNEQTWPTEEEIANAPANVHRTFGTEMMPPPALPGTTPKRLKKVPKGTSTYQAAWILDDDDEDDEDAADRDGDDGMLEEGDEENYQPETGLGEEGDEYEEIDPDGNDTHPATNAPPSTNGMTGTHQDLPMDIENQQYADYLESRKAEKQSRDREAKDDLEFPDEVDTPLDIPARERFARFRGLKSFRTSAWDPYENLPRDYARCFMFSDYKTMGRKLAERAAEDGVEPGTRITIVLKDVPASAAASHSARRPLVIYGLLKHEHKYSVANFTITRNTEYTADVRSKDALLLQLGPRRFHINPIFSQHTQGNGGKGANNVHKFERYLRHGPNSSVGTSYLPITFGTNVPAILFQSTSDGYELVGTGTLLGVDPTRIVAKRIILTGHPYKVHKKTATIRYMFFNQPDVDYFKPVELRTKKGRTGHIKESLGTHGYFKAGFDGPIDQMDTICLNLYKRCFPKWGKAWTVTQGVPSAQISEVAEGDDEDAEMS